MKIRFCRLSFICFLSLFLFLVQPVFGQQISLSISPPLLEVFIKPGKSIMVAYDLKNFGDPTILVTKILPFEPKDNLGNIRIKEEFEGPIRFSLENADLKLEQPFFLKTRDRQQLLLRLRVPERAPEGDYYYTFLVETQPPPTKEGQASGKAKVTIGSHILITVSKTGQVDIKGRIVFFSVRSRFSLGQNIKIFDSSDKIPVVLIVENKGKNLIKPQGEIVLRGNFGETAKYEILPQNILAESQRLLIATPSAETDCLREKKNLLYCRQPITLLLSGFFLGKYTLSTTVIFGEGAPNLFASTSFVALPFKFLLGLIIVFSIGILILKHYQKTSNLN